MAACLTCSTPLASARKFLGEGHNVDQICVPCETARGIVVQQPDGSIDYYSPLTHQIEFHGADEPNVLMEGGRGSGKSGAIRFDGHMRASRWPGFTYLVLRRTMPELRKSHLHFIDYEMKKLGGFYHKTENVAYYPNGSRGYFAHCETEADILNFLSSQFGAIYFDELSTFSLNMFLQISSSARAPEDAPYVAVVRGGTNPLGEGAGWVKQWFLLKNVDLSAFPDYHPDDFKAIFSTYLDNPHINQQAYNTRLSRLPAHERKAWLEGLWVDENGYFADWAPTKLFELPDDWAEMAGKKAVYIPWHVIDELPTVKGKPLLQQPWISIYRALDWGFSPDPAVCLWIAVLPNGRAIVFKEKSWLMTTAADVASDILKQSVGMKVIDTFCDPTMFVASRATEGHSPGDIVEQNGVPLTSSLNDRKAIGLAIHEWLNTILDEQPQIQVLSSGCPELIRTIPEMRIDKSDPARIADGEDHWVITLGYFCQSRIAPSRDPEKPVIPRWMRNTATRRPIGAGNVREM